MNTRWHYILDKNGEPVPTDLYTWCDWLESKNNGKVVKQEEVGGAMVSTVFLGLDHNWGEGPPVLWETMVFRGEGKKREGCEMDRCSGSREQAEAMHQRMVKLIMAKAKAKARRARRKAKQT